MSSGSVTAAVSTALDLTAVIMAVGCAEITRSAGKPLARVGSPDVRAGTTSSAVASAVIVVRRYVLRSSVEVPVGFEDVKG